MCKTNRNRNKIMSRERAHDQDQWLSMDAIVAAIVAASGCSWLLVAASG